ncbi:MAG TPA: AMP-binding protein, partial [Solirubrobacteraceae bacterium]|nr:AMP-binding protein [Solirubrobacteraceae bacterium]
MSSTAIDVQAREGLALDAPNLCEAFARTAQLYGKAPALRRHGDGAPLSWAQYARRVHAIAAGLAELGLDRGDTLAMMLLNSPETVLVDTAAMHLGAIPFSIYNTSSPEQIEYLLRHAKAGVLVSERRFADAIAAVAPDLEELRHVVFVDGFEHGEELTLARVEALGSPEFDLDERRRRIGGGDIATLIYTSGTTGPPKAVELTHENLLWEMRLLDRVFPMRAGGRVVSYLPMAHLAERWNSHYSALLSGATATFCADVAEAIPAVAEVRPTAWGAVPRVWEKLKAALEAGFAAEPDEQRRAALRAALEASLAAVRAEQRGERVDVEVSRRREQADETIFAPLRERLGFGETEHLISGAAPIAVEVLEFFAAIGIDICEIWGMTET